MLKRPSPMPKLTLWDYLPCMQSAVTKQAARAKDMTFDEVKESVEAQGAIDRLESRLTALQEAGVEVSPLLNHFGPCPWLLYAAQDYVSAANFLHRVAPAGNPHRRGP